MVLTLSCSRTEALANGAACDENSDEPTTFRELSPDDRMEDSATAAIGESPTAVRADDRENCCRDHLLSDGATPSDDDSHRDSCDCECSVDEHNGGAIAPTRCAGYRHRCRNEASDSTGSAQEYVVAGSDVVFKDGIEYRAYGSENQLREIMELVSHDLSEPYTIYTYRYFIYNWPHLCIRALDVDRCIGAIVCKLNVYQDSMIRGYIAMLAVDKEYRRRGIGTQLVLCAIKAMIDDDCDDVILEAEIDNDAALRLYENLGFIRDKRLHRYYLNGHDAFRLHLILD